MKISVSNRAKIYGITVYPKRQKIATRLRKFERGRKERYLSTLALLGFLQPIEQAGKQCVQWADSSKASLELSKPKISNGPENTKRRQQRQDNNNQEENDDEDIIISSQQRRQEIEWRVARRKMKPGSFETVR